MLRNRQRPRRPAEATGSASGHVYCADINAPAPLPPSPCSPLRKRLKRRLEGADRPGCSICSSGHANGARWQFSFFCRQARDVLSRCRLSKYVSPIAKLSADELKSKEPSDIEKVEKLLVKVTVAANKDSGSEIELERGAAIAGTVRYDDR